MTSKVHLTTRDSTLALLFKQGEMSASSLAIKLGISVQAMRKHLRSLHVYGLVDSTSIALGPGRPSNLWHLTSTGLSRFATDKGSEKFAVELMSSIEEKFSSSMLNKILNEQALKKALIYRNKMGSGSIANRLQKLVELRNKEGHRTQFYQYQNDSMSWYLNAFHCSIKGVAESFPVVCDQELQLIRYIFPDCSVRRVQWTIEDGNSCGFKITPYIKHYV